MDGEIVSLLKNHGNRVPKKQFVLFLLNFTPLSVERWVESGFKKNDLLQVIHKLKKDGYKIIYDKKDKKYILIKNKPLVLDVKITNKISPYHAYGLLFNHIPVFVEFKHPLNGTKIKRIKCDVMMTDKGLVLKEA